MGWLYISYILSSIVILSYDMYRSPHLHPNPQPQPQSKARWSVWVSDLSQCICKIKWVEREPINQADWCSAWKSPRSFITCIFFHFYFYFFWVFGFLAPRSVHKRPLETANRFPWDKFYFIFFIFLTALIHSLQPPLEVWPNYFYQ